MKKYINIIIIIAIILDLTIFGILIYNNKRLECTVNDLSMQVLKLEERIEEQGRQIYDVNIKVSNIIDENEKEEKQKQYENNPYNIAVNNLDKKIFLLDFDNYKPESNDIKITESKARQIAQIGFEESKKRIAGEGADDADSEICKIEEKNPNNYFTRLYGQSDKRYNDISRKCYVIQRENELGCGIYIYVDVTTGLIIGGGAFGD